MGDQLVNPACWKDEKLSMWIRALEYGLPLYFVNSLATILLLAHVLQELHNQPDFYSYRHLLDYFFFNREKKEGKSN